MVTSFDVFDNGSHNVPDQNKPLKSLSVENPNIDTVKNINPVKEEEVKEKKDRKFRFVSN